jgi:hypothetical protein
LPPPSSPLAHLDRDIQAALAHLEPFTARKEAETEMPPQRSRFLDGTTLVEILDSPKQPFFRKVPVIVSMGGGEVVASLLRQTHVTSGLLLEESPVLARHVQGYQRSLPRGKILEIQEGSFEKQLTATMTRDGELVKEGRGDFVAVLCHCLLQEGRDAL